MTDHDFQGRPARPLVITVEEAHAVLGALPAGGCEGAVPELLRQIITAGRKASVALIPDEPRRPRRQYATIEGMEAAIAAGELAMPPAAGRPLVSDATIAEAAAMQERDQAAGGPPWEVPDHPDNQQPGGWHQGQIGGRA